MPASETPARGAVRAHRDEYDVSIERPSRGIRLRQYVYEIGSYHYNWHQELELLVVLQGEVEVSAGGASHELAAGDVVVINSGVSHATLSREPGTLALLLKLDLAWFDGLFEDASAVRFDVCSDAASRAEPHFVLIRALLAQMMLEAFDTSVGGLVRHERHLTALMDELVTAFPPHVEGPVAALGIESRQRAIDRMLAYIDKHYQERITLDLLGRESGYNPGYVSQLFTRHLGIGMIDYVTRVRLRQATRDLVDPSMKVVDVAASNGFPDVKAFNVAFRKTFGKSPTEYRAQLTADSLDVDARFKQVFARRDDASVTDRLVRLAAPLAGSGPAPVPTLPLGDMRSAVEDARRLASDLERVQRRLGQLAGGLD